MAYPFGAMHSFERLFNAFMKAVKALHGTFFFCFRLCISSSPLLFNSATVVGIFTMFQSPLIRYFPSFLV
jgi:hypothetical protein